MSTDAILATPWWTYIAAFFAAVFLVNGVPHFVHGISGKRFPTPFSGGAGTLDGPVRNVSWGGSNLVVGGVLLWLVRGHLENLLVIVELIVVGMGGGAALGHALSRPERTGGKQP
jgi:hypothetical protein